MVGRKIVGLVGLSEKGRTRRLDGKMEDQMEGQKKGIKDETEGQVKGGLHGWSKKREDQTDGW